MNKLSILALISASMILFSCNDANELELEYSPYKEAGTEEPTEFPEDEVISQNTVSINTEQTTLALVDGQYADVRFTVSLRKLAKAPLTMKFRVTTNMTEDQCSLDHESFTIGVGEKEYTGVISLKGSYFDYDEQGYITIALPRLDKEDEEEYVLNAEKKEFTLYAKKPKYYNPGVMMYLPVPIKYHGVAFPERISIGGIAFQQLYLPIREKNPMTGATEYNAVRNLISTHIAALVPGEENTVIMDINRGGSHAFWQTDTYKFRIAIWADWNGDGDFGDPGETCVSRDWESAPWLPATELMEFKLNVPEDASPSSVIRMGIYTVESATVNMSAGAGSVGSGFLVDVRYILVDTPVAVKPIEQAVLLPTPEYCWPTVFYYGYSAIRTFELNGTTYVESSKNDPTNNADIYSGKWNAYAFNFLNKDMYIQKLKRGETYVFKFTAERHIDYWSCDQKYRAGVWVDWNGDNNFYGEGEELLHVEWFAEWVEYSQPREFIAYLTPPADAVDMARIRFGVYQDSQSYWKKGCGMVQNAYIRDIRYQLED